MTALRFGVKLVLLIAALAVGLLVRGDFYRLVSAPPRLRWIACNYPGPRALRVTWAMQEDGVTYWRGGTGDGSTTATCTVTDKVRPY